MFDYNRTPIAPPGCEIIAFQPPAVRQSWGFHGYKAWYTRPALQHYRCVHAITAATGRESTVETLQFLPHSFRNPTLTPTQLVTVAARDLTNAIKAVTRDEPTNDLGKLTTDQAQRLDTLANIFDSMAKPPTQQEPSLPRVPDGNQTPMLVHTPNPAELPRVSYENPQAGHMEHRTTRDIQPFVLAMPPGPENMHIPHHFAYAVYDPDSGRQLEYRHLIRHPKLKSIWLHAGANEFGRLAQGIRDIPGTDTITFIAEADVPRHKRPTYARFVADIRPQKAEKYRVRMTIGGNLIEYEGDVSSPTGSLTTYKIHCNDIISTPNARAMNLDIENYYLNTPLPSPEYMKVHISLIPDEIITKYNLWDFVNSEGYIFIRLNKGMYGLPQAGILAYNLLVERLAPHGYTPVRHTPGLWKHNQKGTTFVLVVDDFSVKYLNKSDADDFLNLLRTWYTIKVDWEAKLYCGITTEWDYQNRRVTLSMPGYIESFLREINHRNPSKPQHAPHPNLPVQFGREAQLAVAPDTSEPMPKNDPLQPAKIIGKLLYYRMPGPWTVHST